MLAHRLLLAFPLLPTLILSAAQNASTEGNSIVYFSKFNIEHIHTLTAKQAVKGDNTFVTVKKPDSGKYPERYESQNLPYFSPDDNSDQSKLFWSYFSPSSVNRATISLGSYDRNSPAAWQGNHIVNNADNILVLGEFSKISQGPRRRRREVIQAKVEPVLGLSYDPRKQHYLQYNMPYTRTDAGYMWPVRKQENQMERRLPRPGAQAQALPRDMYEQYTPLPSCRHFGESGVTDGIPCCNTMPLIHSFGPVVQPSLFENWVTGLFELGAKYPVMYTLGKSIMVVGAIGFGVIIWALIGEMLGMAEIPRAR